jgi:hypothetical protein
MPLFGTIRPTIRPSGESSMVRLPDETIKGLALGTFGFAALAAPAKRRQAVIAAATPPPRRKAFFPVFTGVLLALRVRP